MDSNNELSFMDNLIAKQVGDVWADGKCKTCICELKNGIPAPACVITECLSIENHPDGHDFVLEEMVLETECCPSFVRIGCKDANHIYEVRI